MIARALAAAALAFAGLTCQAQSWAWDDGTVPFVVSPEEVVDRMLRIADIGPADYVIDLGSGDGRIVIGAARRGARALGIDIDPSLVERARNNAASAGVAERATFVAQDLFDTDLSKASVITMYLLPEVNLKLRPKLLSLAPGTRIVSHDWNMGDWEPDETIELRTPEKPVGLGGKSRVHLWIIPADARGRWVAELPEHGGRWEFDIGQQYQSVTVRATVGGGRDLTVRGTRLRGAEVKMVITGLVGGKPWNQFFRGTISGDRMAGEVLVSDGDQQRTIPWTATRRK
ncbi:MAG: class I SAM-dependent methyltransferase [Proteobacteria bacterium]|nr:class I SAM-dependent methyltransferase [Pseudomonadota bacterium]